MHVAGQDAENCEVSEKVWNKYFSVPHPAVSTILRRFKALGIEAEARDVACKRGGREKISINNPDWFRQFWAVGPAAFVICTAHLGRSRHWLINKENISPSGDFLASFLRSGHQGDRRNYWNKIPG